MIPFPAQIANKRPSLEPILPLHSVGQLYLNFPLFYGVSCLKPFCLKELCTQKSCCNRRIIHERKTENINILELNHAVGHLQVPKYVAIHNTLRFESHKPNNFSFQHHELYLECMSAINESKTKYKISHVVEGKICLRDDCSILTTAST